jgi:HD-like signal output (HDOD) protein
MMMSHEFEMKLEEAIKLETSLPVLSPEASKIQMEAVSRELHFSRIAGVIRKDQALTGKILQIANSPFYRGLGNVDTLKDALTRLGQEEMVHIIMALVHKKNFRSGHPLVKALQERLWHHSVNCALGTLWVARQLGLKELIPKAFIAGLLHDMGKLHVLTATEALLKAGEISTESAENAIAGQLERLHAGLGFKLLKKWHLSESYSRIARDHHCREIDSSDTLLVVVRLVNKLCKPIETGGMKLDYGKAVQMPEARMLHLTEPDIKNVETAILADVALR